LHTIDQDAPSSPQPPGAQAARFWKRAWRAISSGKALQTGIPWLRQRGLPLPLSPHAYAFDRFKRERQARLPVKDFSGTGVAHQPGLVSIILPAYNGEDFIQAALDSILAQTYTDWELIAVDDGSTDSTGAILGRYSQQDSRMRVVHQENRKLPGALKTGFDLARGEFLTWTSVDNLLYPRFLERMVACLRRHPTWDMAYANLDIIDEAGKPMRDSDQYRSYQIPLDSEHIHLPRDPAELNTRPDNYLGAAFLYRSRVERLLGDYSPQHYTFEDYDYWMRVNALMSLRHADFSDPVYAYRFHPKSLTSRDKELAITERRNKLVMFDSSRRDFYLRPLLWRVESTDSDATAAQTAQAFEQMLAAYHHIQIEAGQFDPDSLPRYWFPVIFLLFSNSAELPAPPEDLPSSGLKVLVRVDENHPGSMPPAGNGWDLCVLLSRRAFEQPTGVLPSHFFAVPDAGSLLSALDVWARSQHLAQLEAEIAHPTGAQVRASVVICTYQRTERLPAVLRSIAGQTAPAQDFEVLIVNNDPQARDIQALVAGWRDELFGGDALRLRLVQCPVVGLAQARNAGISEARGEIVCFLDDDAIADPDWLEHILAAYRLYPQAGVVGGKIILKKPQPAPRWLLPGWEVYWTHFDPPYSDFTFVDHWSRYPWGANWSARRQVLLEAGGFPTHGFGRQGSKIQEGEEVALTALIQQMGYGIGIEPRAAVEHQVDPRRFTLSFLLRKIMLGRRRWYQSQVDLYLPAELGLRHSLRRIAAAVWPPSLSALLKAPYILLAEGLLFGWYLRDLLLRMRKPVTLD